MPSRGRGSPSAHPVRSSLSALRTGAVSTPPVPITAVAARRGGLSGRASPAVRDGSWSGPSRGPSSVGWTDSWPAWPS